MRESGSPEILAPRETDCGEDWECRAAQISAKAMSASKFWTSDDRAPRGHRERHAKKEWSAKALRISRSAVKSRCARGWGGWGRLSDDGSRQHNSSTSEDPWGGGYPTSKAVHERALVPTQRGITEVATKCAKGGHKPPSAGVCREQA